VLEKCPRQRKSNLAGSVPIPFVQKQISQPTMPFFSPLPLFSRNYFSTSGRHTELISIYAV